MPMQATDNYSDFVEERSAGVIVVLAEQGERREKEDSTFTISRRRAVDEHAHSCTRARVDMMLAEAVGHAHGHKKTDTRI